MTLHEIESGTKNCESCDQPLTYSVPPQETDTTTKDKIDAGNRFCKNCNAKHLAVKKSRALKKKQEKEQSDKNKQELLETKVQIFERYWHDVDKNGIPLQTVVDGGVALLNIADHRRLMWIFKKYGIKYPVDGFTPFEEARVIKRHEMEQLLESEIQQRQTIDTALQREKVSKGTAKKQHREVNKWRTIENRRLIRQVDGLHRKANKEEEQKPETEREKMVKTPGYRDPQDNPAPRYHLLNDKLTFDKRHDMRGRQIHIIEATDEYEKKIYIKNEEAERRISQQQRQQEQGGAQQQNDIHESKHDNTNRSSPF
jgi:hypothetical protein